ncbi:hypothetical protein MLD38_028072 [Melastoma candidum]|uniref:Uncharacterized protein n=1 Tax=Melastoma candidum TaxID=119954 RepID=A0ACB9N287_9MYRT|nr:hypothetical protein MLD38_028072 [Melastoma candidum]
MSAISAAALTLISGANPSAAAAGKLPVISSSFGRRGGLRLTCSYTVRHDEAAASFIDRERPREIPWSKELTNSVHLIGVVGLPVEMRNLPSGKTVAWTRLAVRKSATETSWISLTFWDELAQTAFQHVEKGQQIYVSGRLVSDEVDGEDGKQQIYYKVVVQQLNFIERSMPSPTFSEQSPYPSSTGKINDNSQSAGSNAELWQAFFANPLEWWDNRRNKRNPKYPDFKHKDTGEALWVEGKYNPTWVKSQLAILDSRMGASREQGGRMPVGTMAGDDILSY